MFDKSVWQRQEEPGNERAFDHPAHTQRVFRVREFSLLIDEMAAKLESIYKRTPFQALAGSGNSGGPILGALSYKLGLPILMVRKPGDTDCADDRRVNGYFGCKGYVIVDDLIASGRTMSRIIKSIDDRAGELMAEGERKWSPEKGDFEEEPPAISHRPKLVAIVLYEQPGRARSTFYSSIFDKEIPVFGLSKK